MFLEDLFQVKIINPLFVDKATVKVKQDHIEDMTKSPEKWYYYGKYHLRFEKWDSIKHSMSSLIKGFGGWLSIKNLHLDLWRRDILQVIEANFGGLESIALDTLILINCTEAKIQVQKKLCGFLPATIELKNENRGNFYLNFGDMESLDTPQIVKSDLFFSDFSNAIDI